ncbi:MAG: Trp operon repressor [candidate division WS6 bacterium OLB21]|uniref:Trp operon repressor n=2 Tax=Candidatus Dojkabacteria TaxID=74243 RepID=A0A136KGX1_9BACT|nr:MAG: Trp operon repressor [candidate division WS6 bacterium OLB21]
MPPGISIIMNNEDTLADLSKAVMKLRDSKEVASFLKDILTRSELEIVLLRWRVAGLLDQGLPYTQIERETGASSATIAKVSEFLKYGYDGYRIAIDRTKKR